MKTFILTMLLSTSLFAATRPNLKTQKEKQKIYESYINENTKIKLAQEDKLFKHQLDFLKRNHELRKIYIKKLNALKSQVSLINKAKNKEIAQKILKLKKDFQAQSEKRRLNFQKDIIGPEIKKFERALNQEKKTINAKLKNLRTNDRG